MTKYIPSQAVALFAIAIISCNKPKYMSTATVYHLSAEEITVLQRSANAGDAKSAERLANYYSTQGEGLDVLRSSLKWSLIADKNGINKAEDIKLLRDLITQLENSSRK